MALWLKIVIGVVVALVVLVIWAIRRAANPPKVPPPNAQTVARRALCLGAFHMRGELEALFQMTTNVLSAMDKAEGAERMAAKLAEPAGKINSWLKAESLWEALSLEERVELDRPLGKWRDQTCRDATWRAESQAVLCWALGLMDLPAPDEQVEAEKAVQVLPHMKPAAAFIASAACRPHAQIEKARDMGELWHWRSRTTQLMKRPSPPKLPDGLTFDKIITMTCDKAREDGAFVPIGGDFPSKGKPYRDLSDEEYSEQTSISMERHYALNWLCGFSANWDTVPTDT